MVRVHLPSVKPYAVYTLLGITVGVFLLQNLSNYLLGGDILEAYGMKVNAYILQGEVWRLITPLFLHASILHILFNMYGLYLFGPTLERAYGHWRFIALYFLSGFAGDVLSFLFTPAASLGASTAIFGLVGAYGIFVYQNRRFLGNSQAALINIVIVVALNLVYDVVPGSGIDIFGHLGGLAGGLIFAWFGGPLWKVEGLAPDLKVVDSRESLHSQLAGYAVLALFTVLALGRFLVK